ncbi:unnamed protein product, partial [Mycena citricolor]
GLGCSFSIPSPGSIALEKCKELWTLQNSVTTLLTRSTPRLGGTRCSLQCSRRRIGRSDHCSSRQRIALPRVSCIACCPESRP